MTQTSGGNQVQSFAYDAHDKLTSGLGESETYDANGNLKTETVNGQTTSYTYDDEDRLTSLTGPSGTSTFTYNGLGLRTGKTDSTGVYAYVCDGTSPGPPVLADGLAVYTPGLSDHRSGASTFSHTDFLGSLRFLTDSGQNVTANLLPDAFGETVSQMGTVATPFGWNGGSGYQSDADGLKLLGHRYYNSRTGRFISQDPAGSGDNWYAYADNNPTNEMDPEGLTPTVNIEGWSPVGTPGYSDGAASGSAGAMDEFETFTKYTITHNWIQDEKQGADGLYHYVDRPGSDTWSFSQSILNAQGAAEVGELSEDGVAVGKPGNPLNLLKQDLKSIRSHVDSIEEHTAKIKQYKSDPHSMDNKGTLSNPKSAEHIEKIMQGRITVLEQAIARRYNDIIKILSR